MTRVEREHEHEYVAYFEPRVPWWFYRIGGKYWDPYGSHRMKWGELSTRGTRSFSIGFGLYENHFSFNLAISKLSAHVTICRAWRDPAEPPCDLWGISSYEGESLHLNWGDYCKIFEYPWKKKHIIDQYLMSDGSWCDDRGFDVFDDAAPDRWQSTYPVVYLLDRIWRDPSYRSVQWANATVKVTRRLTAPALLGRFRWWPRREKRYIEVRFDTDIGEEAGSWKGGCVGCWHEMRPEETPKDTLQRMMKERRF